MRPSVRFAPPTRLVITLLHESITRHDPNPSSSWGQAVMLSAEPTGTGPTREQSTPGHCAIIELLKSRGQLLGGHQGRYANLAVAAARPLCLE